MSARARRKLAPIEAPAIVNDPPAGSRGTIAITVVHAKPGQDLCVSLPSGGYLWVGRQDVCLHSENTDAMEQRQ